VHCLPLVITDRPRVLIVDDELGVRESLRALLKGECEVRTAASGDEALEILGRESFDIMTLDLRMPGTGGIRVLERAKQIDPDLEVLIITGYGSFDTAVQGLRFRAFDYIAKPFDCDQVRRLVQVALGRRAAARRLKAAPEQLLSTLSHELRTPLNVILGYSAMLRDEGDPTLTTEQRRVLDRIDENSVSLLGYVETMLYVAELDRGVVPLEVGPVRVGEALSRLSTDFEPRARAKKIGWRLEAPADLVISSDGPKLLRLVRTLAENALRFTTAGTVMLVAWPGPDGITIEIRDTGPGLGPEVIIETEDLAAGRSGGEAPRHLGYGLRLAGRLVRVLGGSLTFAASRAGTTCLLRIPNLAAEENVASRATA